MTSYYINTENLQKAQSYLSRTVEVCGYLKQLNPTSQELTPVIAGVAGTDGRPLCVYDPPYETILWHSHAFTMQSYPSAEDIIKALKPRSNPNQVLDNIIFTNWGIWEFYAEIKASVDEVDEVNQKSYLQQSYSGLYHISERGRGKFSESIMPFIDSYITDLTYHLEPYKFSIHFTPWVKLPGGDNRKYYLRRKF
jgi:hypothetical protein